MDINWKVKKLTYPDNCTSSAASKEGGIIHKPNSHRFVGPACGRQDFPSSAPIVTGSLTFTQSEHRYGGASQRGRTHRHRISFAFYPEVFNLCTLTSNLSEPQFWTRQIWGWRGNFLVLSQVLAPKSSVICRGHLVDNKVASAPVGG